MVTQKVTAHTDLAVLNMVNTILQRYVPNHLSAKCALCNGNHFANYLGQFICKELQQRCRPQPSIKHNNPQHKLVQFTNQQTPPINQSTLHPTTSTLGSQFKISYAETTAFTGLTHHCNLFPTPNIYPVQKMY